MSTTKYTLIPRGPVRGIGENTTITEKCEIELNDFQALKVLLQGHSLLKGAKMDEVVKISDFVEDVDPQVIKENVNLVEDYTAGNKRTNVSHSKVFGLPRDFAPNTSEVDKTGKVDGNDKADTTPKPVTSTETSESTSETKSDKASESTSAASKSANTSTSTAKSASESAKDASAASETEKK